MLLHPLGCCGIKEIQGLTDWDTNRDSFFHMVKTTSGLLPCGWVCFNGVERHDYVKNFAAFLAEHKLGEVITLPNITNPNSGNLLDVRMWAVNREALLAWYKARASKECECYSCINAKRSRQVFAGANAAQPRAAQVNQAIAHPQAAAPAQRFAGGELSWQPQSAAPPPVPNSLTESRDTLADAFIPF